MNHFSRLNLSVKNRKFSILIDRSISPWTNFQVALVIWSQLCFDKKLTFKRHFSDFYVNWTINNKPTVVKVKLFVHLWKMGTRKMSYIDETLLFCEKTYRANSAMYWKILYRLCFVENNLLPCARMDTNNAERSGRPTEAVTPEIRKYVLKIANWEILKW